MFYEREKDFVIFDGSWHPHDHPVYGLNVLFARRRWLWIADHIITLNGMKNFKSGESDELLSPQNLFNVNSQSEVDNLVRHIAKALITFGEDFLEGEYRCFDAEYRRHGREYRRSYSHVWDYLRESSPLHCT